MQYLFTERAHLMCPRMHFGIVLSVRAPYEEGRIRDTMEQLSAAHPFLNAVLGYEEEKNAYYYRVTNRPTAELLLTGTWIPDVDAPEVIGQYETLTARDWDLFDEGMLKAAAWPTDGGTCFLLVFHHLLADGRGALGLAEELADCYCRGKRPAGAEEQLIASAEAFPADSRLPFVSRFLVGRANKTQAKEGHRVSWQEYHAFADAFLKTDPVRYSLRRSSTQETEALRKQCREHGVTVNDYALAKMMSEEHTDRVTIACDLRNRLGCYREGALGNYSTAFSVEMKRKDTDLFSLAEAVHQQVQHKMSRPADLYLVLQCYAALDPAVTDAAFISCRGGFHSRAGRFAGSMFFGYAASRGYCITNLGSIESGSMASAYFIPPASPAIRKTRGILTVNGMMTVCDCERPGEKQNEA